MTKKQKNDIIEKFKDHPSDTGSAAVQIGLLSERINYLSEHLKNNKKDFHSRRGLLMLVNRRRSLLGYLKKNDSKKYNNILAEINTYKK